MIKLAIRAMAATMSMAGKFAISTGSVLIFIKVDAANTMIATENKVTEVTILPDDFFQMSEFMGINVLDYKVVVSSGGLFLTRIRSTRCLALDFQFSFMEVML